MTGEQGEQAMRFRIWGIVVAAAAVTAAEARPVFSQGYGTDLQNVMCPVSGGMAGVSVALPQDVPSAVFGNPATLSQFEGTQFTIGGGWIEGYPTLTNDGSLNGGTPFSVTSRSEGFTGTEIGVSQDLRSLGVQGSFGAGLAGLSGVGAEYRGLAPGTILDNLNNEYLVLGVNMAAGFQITDRLSVGSSITLGSAFEQLGFVGPLVGSAMVNAYALRGTVGVDYQVTDCNTIGFYYQSRMDFTFENAVRFNGVYNNLRVDQPDTFGLGIANRSLMGGDLLLAADAYYKLWEDAALWQDVLINQWAFAAGAELTRGKMKFRIGYSYNSNPINHQVGGSLDGFPVLQSNVQLFQAASVPLVNQNRITAGFGRKDLLVEGLDLDFFAGGMFKASNSFGPDTSTGLAIYYLGAGLTWRFGAPSHASSAASE
jgi:long-chain fatty acid transport protein